MSLMFTPSMWNQGLETSSTLKPVKSSANTKVTAVFYMLLSSRLIHVEVKRPN